MKAIEARDGEKAEKIISTHWGGEGFLNDAEAEGKTE
jgi:hypothetical protein